ncbi:MAG: hypothetical protein ACKV19_12940 [Verrucomicrobiales bacterium]
MSTSPRSRVSPAATERSPSSDSEHQTVDADSPEIKVPRSIIKWSKWRQATLRAEHREARQQLRASTPRPDSHPSKNA